MKRLIYLIFFFIICKSITGQNFQASLNMGYGFYQFNDLKDFQSDLRDRFLSLPVKEVEKFPGYFNYSASLEYQIDNRNYLGFNGAFYFSGARNHIKDYSGEYKLDMPINGYRIGIQYRNKLSTINKLNLYAQLRSGVMLSNLKIKEYFIIYNVDTLSEKSTFRSVAFFCEPAIGVLYNFKKKFSMDLCIGYQIDIKNKLHLKDNMDIKLREANWSGLKLSLGLCYKFW